MHSRLGIAHVVGIVARFSSNPKKTHMTIVKRIFKYLKGIEDFGLWYKQDDDFNLKVYTDADWAGNVDDRKSTSGGGFFFRERLITWTSKKQSCISQSTAKADYVVAAINCSNILWIKQLVEGMQEEITEHFTIYCDNIVQ